MGLQGQNAFNDKALQFTLVPLGAWVAAQASASWGSTLPHLLGMLILLPFILLAPIAGWASDTFSKTRVIRFTAWMQLIVLGIVLGSFGLEALPITVACFFFLAVQSTILSPAKNGIIKELLGSDRLGFASGIMQMCTILAILAGQILLGIWFSARLESTGSGWQAGLLPMILITLGALVTIAMAYSIQVVPAQGKKPFTAALVGSHFQQLGLLFKSAPLRLSALGVAYFWVFGAIIQFITLQVAGELYPDGHANFGRSTSFMMLAASGGIGVGSVLGALINKRHIELGLNPLGGIIMMVASLLLIWATPETTFFYGALSMAGLGAAFFFVPINAFLQDKCDPDQRGNILAASSLLNCLAMAGAVVLQLAMMKAGLSTETQFFLVALASVGATWYVMRLLPRAFVKLLVMSALRAIYRIEAIDSSRMPEKSGVLLTPNHISYLDALILTAASPRPVRFLMVSHYFKKPLIGKFAKLFDAVPISTTRAKDAIQIAATAIEEGNVVCIFAEGELSRSGFLGEFKRGFELIARKADCLVQPVYLDGLWKSIFSAERGKFIRKMPRAIPFGVRVAFGEPRRARECSAAEVKGELNALAGTVFSQRRESADTVVEFLEHRKNKTDALSWNHEGRVHTCTWGEVRGVLEGSADPAGLSAGHAGAEGWLADWKCLAELPEKEWQSLLLNAHQLADPYNLGNGKAAVLIDCEASATVRRVWGMLLPVITKTQAVSIGRDDNAASLTALRKSGVVLRDLVGTDRVRDLVGPVADPQSELVLYRFGGSPQGANEARKGVYAAYEAAGRILTISIPPDPIIRKNDVAHPGWKEGSYGRLLTGFVINEFESGFEVSGEMLSEAIEFPGWSVDERGFLWGTNALEEEG
jgi:acyl-[acyl-carrier-protein]-phospholipid O-acyltransferase/long-chain-fatty-acid--[acyl-carrier-protein] ligase